MSGEKTARQIEMIIDPVCGHLLLRPDSGCLGIQYDQNVTTLQFTRPPGYESDELWLYWSCLTEPIGIGQHNTFVVDNYLTQDTGVTLQAAFHSGGTEVKRSKPVTFALIESVPPGNMTPTPVPDVLSSLADAALCRGAYDPESGDLTLYNSAGTTRFSATIKGGGGVSEQYVNDGDTATLTAAKGYTDGLAAELHPVAHTGDYNALANRPASLPASDVAGWAKQPAKPGYTADEVGAVPSAGYVATANSYTNEDKSKLAGIASGATRVLKTSDIANDSGYVVDPAYVHTDNNYSAADKSKLAGLSNYTLPAATASTLGGVKAGAGVSIAVDGTINVSAEGAVSSVNNKTGAVTLNASDVGAVATTGDISNTVATFAQAATRVNLTAGEKLSVLFGKIMRWFADLKAVAFTGAYSDLTGAPTSLPASDVSPWAKAATKPTYTAAEVGAASSAQVNAKQDKSPNDGVSYALKDGGLTPVATIQGSKGDKGDTGQQGPKGDTGAQGAPGTSILVQMVVNEAAWQALVSAGTADDNTIYVW